MNFYFKKNIFLFKFFLVFVPSYTALSICCSASGGHFLWRSHRDPCGIILLSSHDDTKSQSSIKLRIFVSLWRKWFLQVPISKGQCHLVKDLWGHKSGQVPEIVSPQSLWKSLTKWHCPKGIPFPKGSLRPGCVNLFSWMIAL